MPKKDGLGKAWRGIGGFAAVGPAVPTEFELEVKKLKLKPEQYDKSQSLRAWINRNRNRVYVPEELLEKLGYADE